MLKKTLAKQLMHAYTLRKALADRHQIPHHGGDMLVAEGAAGAAFHSLSRQGRADGVGVQTDGIQPAGHFDDASRLGICHAESSFTE